MHEYKPNIIISPKPSFPLGPKFLLGLLLGLLLILGASYFKLLPTNFSLFTFTLSVPVVSEVEPVEGSPAPTTLTPLENQQAIIKQVSKDSILVQSGSATTNYQLTSDILISEIRTSTSSAVVEAKEVTIPARKLSIKDLKVGTTIHLVIDSQGKLLQVLIFK